MNILDEVDKHRQDIVTDTYTVTWRELLGQYQDGELAIDPEYQRLFRWDIEQQTQYIESILLNIPSPPLFLARNADGKFEVIDGLQRVSTMLKFFSLGRNAPDVEPCLNDDEETDQNNITVPSILSAGPLIPSLEGFSSLTLPETLIRTIKYARITIILLEKESTTRARYEVFRRLNKQGSPLSDQEIRNCTSRLLGKEFPTQLRQLASNLDVRDALSLNDDAQRRMGVEECLLRFLALNFSEKKLKHHIREYLDDFMSFASEGKFKLTPEMESRIVRSFQLLQQSLPNGEAFKFPKLGFSSNLFDIVLTGAYHNLDHLTVDELKRKFYELLDSQDIKNFTGAGSNTRKKLQGRIDLGKQWFSK